MMNGNKDNVMKKTQGFCQVREVRGWHRDSSDEIRSDWPLEIDIDVIPGHEIGMDPHTVAQKPAPSLGVSPQVVINHLHHDLKMKPLIWQDSQKAGRVRSAQIMLDALDVHVRTNA
jgi:hypothetical protein